jgi:hypothetical protein
MVRFFEKLNRGGWRCRPVGLAPFKNFNFYGAYTSRRGFRIAEREPSYLGRHISSNPVTAPNTAMLQA